MKKFLSGPGEWFTAIGALLSVTSLVPHVPATWTPYMKPAGMLLFLGGLVTTIRDIRNKQRDLSARLTPVTVAAEAALQYGSAVSVISEALSEIEGKSEDRPHVRAGGRALQDYALTVLPGRARELRAHLSSNHTITFAEHHFLNDFLRKLVEALPNGSVWLGITHLTDGWLRETAEPGYRDFVESMQARSRTGQLRILRIYCYKDASSLEALRPHLEDEKKSGVVIRILPLTEDAPPDLSLIWPPLHSITLADLEKHPAPTKLFGEKRCKPICGMEFATGAGRFIREFKVYATSSGHVLSLQQQFDTAWRKSTSPP